MQFFSRRLQRAGGACAAIPREDKHTKARSAATIDLRLIISIRSCLRSVSMLIENLTQSSATHLFLGSARNAPVEIPPSISNVCPVM